MLCGGAVTKRRADAVGNRGVLGVFESYSESFASFTDIDCACVYVSVMRLLSVCKHVCASVSYLKQCISACTGSFVDLLEVDCSYNTSAQARFV